MAEMALKKGHTKEIKAVANKILKDQSSEIKQMEAWRERKFAGVPKAEEMPSKMDMSKLESSKGKDFDKMFAQMMAKHHEGGIQMSKELSSQLQDPEIKKFAEKVSKNQLNERDHLKDLQTSMEKNSGRSTSSQF